MDMRTFSCRFNALHANSTLETRPHGIMTTTCHALTISILKSFDSKKTKEILRVAARVCHVRVRKFKFLFIVE